MRRLARRYYAQSLRRRRRQRRRLRLSEIPKRAEKGMNLFFFSSERRDTGALARHTVQKGLRGLWSTCLALKGGGGCASSPGLCRRGGSRAWGTRVVACRK